MKVNTTSRMRRKEAMIGFLLISPWIVGFCWFLGGPIFFSLFLSFVKWDIFSPPKFVGLRNYQRMFTDPLFWQALKVTFIYAALSVLLRLVIALLVAVFLNQKIKGISIFRTIYYLPTIIAGVVVALVWNWLFHPDFGVINFFLYKLFGIIGPNWLFSEFWVLPALIVMSAWWGIGQSMIIFLAGLQGIPASLYEVAELDGANALQKFWAVTIPMLSPVIFFNLIILLIYSFQSFTFAFVMTNGGPNNASLFYVFYLYKQAFRFFDMGYGSALSWILFLIILVFTFLIFKTSNLWVYYEAAKGR